MIDSDIVVSAVVIRDPGGRVLTVRKRQTTHFILPGGKLEEAETAADAAVREVDEELGLALDPLLLRPLGTFQAAAANEPNRKVTATVFEHPNVGAPASAREIEELRWTHPEVATDDIAPLLTQAVFPALLRNSVRSLTIFTGSAMGDDARYREIAAELAESVAEAGVRVVYGGGKVGLMGVVADAALARGGEVVGVMPRSLVDGEIGHNGLTRLEIVASMHERKTRMAELGDAFVALPGGVGTLEEFFEAWTWQQLGLHAKPIAVYDTAFWHPLLDLIDHMVGAGFVKSIYRDALVLADSPEGLMRQLAVWQPPTSKWR